MALLAVEEKQDLSERLEEFSQYGMVLKYMLDREFIELSDLKTMFFDTDREKASLIYFTLIKKMKPIYMQEAFDLYSGYYPNCDLLDDSEYASSLNKQCVNDIIFEIKEDNKGIDKTYFNTYSFLLNEAGCRVARK